jgi:hypothetical protein
MAIYKNTPPIVTNNLSILVDTINQQSLKTGSSTWNDLSGNSFNGTLVNNPTYSISPFPLLDFTTNPTGSVSTGINQNIIFSSSSVPLSGSFSIDMWMWRDSATVTMGDRESLFSNTGGADGFRFQITTSGPGTILAYLIGGAGGIGYSEGAIGSNYDVADAKWHHVVCVYDRVAQLGTYTVYGYVDGVLKGTVSIVSTNLAFTAQTPGISLGCCSKFKGKIAKLFVYKKALSQIEVLQNYNANKTFFNKL